MWLRASSGAGTPGGTESLCRPSEGYQVRLPEYEFQRPIFFKGVDMESNNRKRADSASNEGGECRSCNLGLIRGTISAISEATVSITGLRYSEVLS